MQTQQIPPNKQEISLQSQQIRHRHRHSLVSTNYGPMLTVMDVISVQHTHICEHTHTSNYTREDSLSGILISIYFCLILASSLAELTHTPVFYILFYIPPISLFSLEGYTILLPSFSLPFHMPSPPLLVLPSSSFLLFSSKFSCVIPSPRTPLISPFLHV